MSNEALQAPLVSISLDTVVGYEYRGGPDDSGGPPIRLVDQLLDVATHKLLEQVQAAVLEDVKRRVSDEVTTAVRAQVAETIRAALQGEIQETDSWGHPKGSSKT